ncbi:MAG TPA: FtsX-like permease family protein, partial [Ignavibacteriales bacterium]|nr:FtsX-like permease family protein [Ignavibacteriales bacterium]
AAAELGWKDPSQAIGKSFELIGSKKGTIIGVVKNFYFTSLQHKIEPVALTIWPWSNYILVRTEAGRLPGILSDFEKVWNEYDPENPFTYSFLEDDFNEYYKQENLYAKLSGFFALLAIIIAGIGLFSLSAFIAEQSAKEYGIRKVLGASIESIIVSQLKKYSILILIANAASIPASLLIISAWLDNFAYKIQLDFSVFLIAGAGITLTVLAASGFHIVRTSLRNPIESLRHE